MGAPTSDEAGAPYGGRFNNFQRGSIYWHPKIGAFGVWDAIGGKWNEAGRVAYGYPITDQTATSDGRGRYNHFKAVHLKGQPQASIFWSPQTGAHTIYGAIRDKWASLGWELGLVPTTDEFQDGGYRRSNFERGYIRWSTKAGAEAFGPDGQPALRSCDITAGLPPPFNVPC